MRRQNYLEEQRAGRRAPSPFETFVIFLNRSAANSRLQTMSTSAFTEFFPANMDMIDIYIPKDLQLPIVVAVSFLGEVDSDRSALARH